MSTAVCHLTDLSWYPHPFFYLPAVPFEKCSLPPPVLYRHLHHSRLFHVSLISPGLPNSCEVLPPHCLCFFWHIENHPQEHCFHQNPFLIPVLQISLSPSEETLYYPLGFHMPFPREDFHLPGISHRPPQNG